MNNEQPPPNPLFVRGKDGTLYTLGLNDPITVNPPDEDELPCRCGTVHIGPYAIYEWMHHNCFHNAPLQRIGEITGYYMCPDCGKHFWLAEHYGGEL